MTTHTSPYLSVYGRLYGGNIYVASKRNRHCRRSQATHTLGFAVGLVMFRGAWDSEGELDGYRHLGWGERWGAGEMPVVADPEHPADTGTGSSAFPGAHDARPFESSGAPGSVLTFTSDVLRQPMEWTGALRAKLFVRVGEGSADASFLARVSDVYPDGRSILIADYTRLVSLRDGLNCPRKPLSAGEICALDFRIGWLSLIWAPGHRIRITIACTGGPLHETWNVSHGIKATHQLAFGAGQASHVLAPMPCVRGVGEGAGVTGRRGEDGKEQGRAFLEELSKGIFPS